MKCVYPDCDGWMTIINRYIDKNLIWWHIWKCNKCGREHHRKSYM